MDGHGDALSEALTAVGLYICWVDGEWRRSCWTIWFSWKVQLTDQIPVPIVRVWSVGATRVNIIRVRHLRFCCFYRFGN